MSRHDDPGFDDLGPGDGLGPGRDVLRQTIEALVDGATPRGLPSVPEENLGRLRRRVRTWRIAKAGAVGVGTAVVISALAFSAAEASTWTRTEPLPGRPTIQSTDSGPVPSEVPTTLRSMSPTVSPSPSPSPSLSPSDVPAGVATPDPSASATVTDPADVITAPFDDGYRPWLDAYPVWCGMSEDDLVSVSPTVSIEIVGELTYERGQGGTIPVRLTGEMPGYVDPSDDSEFNEVIADDALLIWSQGGRVVDLGSYWREGNYEIPPALNDTGEWTGLAYAQPYTSCIEADLIEGGPFGYDNERAAGTYQVRAAQMHTIGRIGYNDAPQYLVLSEPVTVTIP